MHHALAMLALTAALPLVACGEDEEKGRSGAEPTKVAMELKSAGKQTSVTAPESVQAGVVTVDLKNSTKKHGGLQFVRIVGDHTPAEVIKVGRQGHAAAEVDRAQGRSAQRPSGHQRDRDPDARAGQVPGARAGRQ
jgi:hypothetical protein